MLAVSYFPAEFHASTAECWLLGVVVSQVDPNSDAAAAGLEQGDVIQEVNRRLVHNVAEYQEAAAGVGNQPVLLLVNRGGTTHYVVIQPQ